MAKSKAGEFEGYRESEHFIPNPTDQTGIVRTDGVTGGLNDTIGAVTGIFEQARRNDLRTAARALDPDDDGVDESLVVLPSGATVVHGDPEAARERVLKTADKVINEDDGLDNRSAAAKEAGEEFEVSEDEVPRDERNAVHLAATRAEASRKRGQGKAGSTTKVGHSDKADVSANQGRANA